MEETIKKHVGESVLIYTWTGSYVGMLKGIDSNIVTVVIGEKLIPFGFPLDEIIGIQWDLENQEHSEDDYEDSCDCHFPELKAVPCGIGPGAKTFQLCSCCGKEYPYTD